MIAISRNIIGHNGSRFSGGVVKIYQKHKEDFNHEKHSGHGGGHFGDLLVLNRIIDYKTGSIKDTDVIISSGITTASNCNRFSFVDPLFMREITIIDLKKSN